MFGPVCLQSELSVAASREKSQRACGCSALETTMTSVIHGSCRVAIQTRATCHNRRHQRPHRPRLTNELARAHMWCQCFSLLEQLLDLHFQKQLRQNHLRGLGGLLVFGYFFYAAFLVSFWCYYLYRDSTNVFWSSAISSKLGLKQD